jgi:hypothetical protein
MADLINALRLQTQLAFLYHFQECEIIDGRFTPRLKVGQLVRGEHPFRDYSVSCRHVE